MNSNNLRRKTAAFSLRTSLAIVLCAGLAVPAFAHDAWVAPRGKQFVVLYGHGDEVEAYAATKVKEVLAVSTTGAPLKVTRTEQLEAVWLTVAGQPSLITVHFDNGYWSKTAPDAKSQNVAKNELPGAVSGSHSVKFGKTVLGWGPTVTRAQGHKLEIVPVASQAPATGSRMQVQVLWDGQPLAQAKIKRSGYKDEAAFETDAQGRASVAVDKGTQMIVVNRRLDLQGDPRADTVNYAANLIFTAQ